MISSIDVLNEIREMIRSTNEADGIITQKSRINIPPKNSPKDFYIYSHNKVGCPLPFYIGKGRKNRAWNKSSRSNAWKEWVGKDLYEVKIIKDGLTESQAFDLEGTYISFYRRMCDGGCLINLTKGRNGYTQPDHRLQEKYDNIEEGLDNLPGWHKNITISNRIRSLDPEWIMNNKLGQKMYEKLYSGFRDPQGKVYSPVEGLNEFARSHGLTAARLRCLVKGTEKTHRGWSYVPENELSPEQLKVFTNLTNETYSEKYNRRVRRRKYALDE